MPLRLLGEHHVDYLLIGGHAVAHYGYPRPTANFGVSIALTAATASAAVRALEAFGFAQPSLTPALLLEPGTIVRMGLPNAPRNHEPDRRRRIFRLLYAA